MPGKCEVAWAVAARGEQILDRAVRCLADHEPVDREADRDERRFEHVEHRAPRGRDAVRTQ